MRKFWSLPSEPSECLNKAYAGGFEAKAAPASPVTTFEQMFPDVDLTSGYEASRRGQIELLTPDCAIGWAALAADGSGARLIATLDGKVIGSCRADLKRDDLESAKVQGRAFVMTYDNRVAADAINAVAIRSVEDDQSLPESVALRRESSVPCRVFVLGSPRSGTSQLAATLVSVLGLPWTGEAHVAARFAAAADNLGGDPKSPNQFERSLSTLNFRQIAIEAARRGYFFEHSSASFLDKTPGIDMVKAAPFMAGCFPDARFVFIRRHPIANMVSRLAKFGGNFDEHCHDWAATLEQWRTVKPTLPAHLELDQERMASAPTEVAAALAEFFGRPDLEAAITASLATSFLERTGAGAGCVTLEQTSWSDLQKARFVAICGPTMARSGYAVPNLDPLGE